MFKPRNLSLLAFVTGVSVLVFLIAGSSPEKAVAQAPSAFSAGALAGRMLIGSIRAAAGKPLEGVVVSARDVTKTFTTSVFTDEQGNYFFPVLDKGQYRVWAQAVGFEAGRAEVQLDLGRETRRDFTLKTLDDFTSQLTGSEWMAALPGDTFEDRRMKEIIAHNCAACHPPSFPLQNRFDKAGWLAILTAMETASSGGNVAASGLYSRKTPLPIIHHFKEELAEYLAKVRGPGPSPMKFKPLPRPTGEAARAVITEYDIPPVETPDQLAVQDGSDWSEGTPPRYLNEGNHDVTEDFDGNAWVAFNGAANHTRSYSKIDAKTGKVTYYKVPGSGRGGFVRSSHEVTTGPDGMIWITLSGSRPGAGTLGRIDPKTGNVELFDAPESMTPVAPGGGHIEVDGKGKVWAVTRRGGIRFDPDTRQFTHDFISPSENDPKFSTYGLGADSEGNGWWAILTLDKVGGSDLKTGKVREVQYAPRKELLEFTTEEDRKFYNRTENLGPLSNNTSAVGLRTPRRMAGDIRGFHMWSSDFYGDDIASVDIRTLKVDYYPLPIPYSHAYDLHVDYNHAVWATLRSADRVGKLDPATKKWTVYQLPSIGNETRNIYADGYNKTGNVWLAASRTSKAIRLQFRTEQQLAAAARH